MSRQPRPGVRCVRGIDDFTLLSTNMSSASFLSQFWLILLFTVGCMFLFLCTPGHFIGLSSSPPAQFPHLETVRSTGSSGPQPWERARSPLSVGTDPRDPCGWCPVAAPSRPAEKRPGCTRRRRPSPFTHLRAASLFPVWGRSK